MRRFQELVIEHNEEELVRLLNKLKEDKKSPFEYRTIISNGFARSTFIKPDHVGLFKSSRKSQFESMVWVVIKGNTLKVVNIVPSTRSTLGIEQYNSILTSFVEEFIRKHIDENWNDRIHITGEMVDIRTLLSPRCYDALMSWEGTCNKSAPISHPQDEQRWLLFVSYLHKDKDQCNFDLSDFTQWLSEDQHWPSGYNEQIYELQVNLEYSLTLLDYYDRV